jgi:hypothetical protein
VEIMTRLPSNRPNGAVVRRPPTIKEIYEQLPADVQVLVRKYPHLWQRAADFMRLFPPNLVSQTHIEVILILLDDSGSIQDRKGSARDICTGINAFLQQYREGDIRNVLVAAWLMNRASPLLPLTLIEKVVFPREYPAEGHTPMHDTQIAGLFYQVLLTIWYQGLLGEGLFMGSTTVMCADGQHTDTPTPAADAKILADYLRSRCETGRERHDIFGVGVGYEISFRPAYMAMGILPEDIHLASNLGRVRLALTSAGETSVTRALAQPIRKAIALSGGTAPTSKRRFPGWWPKSR